ncbi:MAG TPA: hypothetical protein VNA69_07490 [Thermoanaerobaculia bacterium]|nr:hypothetical protein [Thermoanaerobaculia bacterium]
MDPKKTLESMFQRLRRLVNRRRPREPVIESEPTSDDARRAEELLEKHGWEHLRDEKK